MFLCFLHLRPTRYYARICACLLCSHFPLLSRRLGRHIILTRRSFARLLACAWRLGRCGCYVCLLFSASAICGRRNYSGCKWSLQQLTGSAALAPLALLSFFRRVLVDPALVPRPSVSAGFGKKNTSFRMCLRVPPCVSVCLRRFWEAKYRFPHVSPQVSGRKNTDFRMCLRVSPRVSVCLRRFWEAKYRFPHVSPCVSAGFWEEKY